MSSEEFKCIFCKESFDNKETLQVHFRKHGDKNFHLNKGRSQDDPPSSDMPASSKDQVEMVECDVCPETFTSISKAITHKHKVHPDHDAKYFCPWCGKLFTMKHLYNKHIHTTHQHDEMMDKSFHCDVCDVAFNSAVAVMYHNKFFHRIFDMPTIGNSKKLKMIGQEAVQIFYCPFCGEEYDNKVNLHKHMSDDHNDENQHPDDVLRCPVCDAIFYHLDAYELHLTYHCIDDMYSERSEILDEITDFSLESVPPLAEKVESVEAQGDDGAMGIEQLFELTMDDQKKKKKHKKHKKSKKSAITLDQFLNMNTDVFGEGLDFQGVEEVPSQIIAKRLKKPMKKPAQLKLSPDIEKLKRQGIVIKKKGGKATVKPSVGQRGLVVNKINKTDEKKLNSPVTPHDVLTKLFNQNNSQIKIVMKSNLEANTKNESSTTSAADDVKVPVENKEPNGTELVSSIPKGDDVDANENNKIDKPEIDDDVDDINKITIPENKNEVCSDDEKSNHSQSILDKMDEKVDVPIIEKAVDVVDKLTALRNNSNIVIKSSYQQNNREIKISKETAPKESNENVSSRREDTNPDINGESNKNDSLNAFKHLSHLTVKPCNQENKSASNSDNKPVFEKKADQPELSKIAHLIRSGPAKLVTNPVKNSSTVSPQTNTQHKEEVIKSEESNFNSDDEHDERNDENITTEEPMQTTKLAHILNSPHLNIQAIKKSPKPLPQKESPTDIIPKNEKSSTNLLKHLKNVTAKPVAVNKTFNVTTPSPKLSPNLNSIKKEPVTPPIKHSKIIQEDIEIFNIDDSDSDETNSNTAQITKPGNKETPVPIKSAKVFKNINKNITIKSVNNHKTSNKDIDKAHDDHDVNDTEAHQSPLPTTTRNLKLSNPQISQKQSALNNVLKNLSKNITVKSGNTSPAQFSATQDNSQDSYEQEDESDTDSIPGRVKIMEMDNASDEEDKEPDTNENPVDNIKVQYPDDSNSDGEGDHKEEHHENFSDEDIETQIATNAVIKTMHKPNLDNLKNVCKDLVIKPSGQAMNRLSQFPSASDEIPAFAKSLSNQISIKNLKQADNSNKQVKINNATTKNIEPTVGRLMNKSAVNQKMSTVNKEVKTVKTFQSKTQTKTVIQEITTTVTKTIKTVNQSTKQEIKNCGQSSFTPQKIQQNVNNASFQGVKVRQTTPLTGPRIRNPGIRPTRPMLAGPIRASNQLVPVRPRFNAPRQSMPRMPTVRPSTSAQPMPQIGAQVKIAPGVVATTKRTNEASGHFSCFKKPKESLFPETDFSAMNRNDGESSVNFSAMQMSKSNYACTTQTVKGNSVVTATQIKSEMSASSQQLGKLRNLSGLSIVKTSQANQSHAEERIEMSAAKQNTLDAIQRLQSQGLLVKKPRLVSEENVHSNQGSDEHFSDEEFGS